MVLIIKPVESPRLLNSRYLSWTKLKLLRFALSLRTQSPKIEMFQQVAIDRGVDQLGCDAVVEFRGKLSCSLPESAAAGEAQTAADSSIFSVDHVHPHSDREKELVVLYADAESESFGKLHSQILDLVRLGKVTYVFRHFLPNRSRQKARMSGKLLAVNSHFFGVLGKRCYRDILRTSLSGQKGL